jgi:DNA-binding XRE family transcriptional regulator
VSDRPGQRGATLKQGAVITLVRDMITDGTLLPGAPVPSATELAGKAGCCARTCRAALRRLLKDGTLTQGPSPTARLRVAIDGTGRAAVRVPLSSALAALRHSAGLTQPELATLAGVTVTTVGHAETGYSARRVSCCACMTSARRAGPPSHRGKPARLSRKNPFRWRLYCR